MSFPCFIVLFSYQDAAWSWMCSLQLMLGSSSIFCSMFKMKSKSQKKTEELHSWKQKGCLINTSSAPIYTFFFFIPYSM
uniref:Uncharacterized protein n=1 Tax=Arundo donax TaxID=35708 RepID=A0A0A9BRL3_ARUDO